MYFPQNIIYVLITAPKDVDFERMQAVLQHDGSTEISSANFHVAGEVRFHVMSYVDVLRSFLSTNNIQNLGKFMQK